LVGEDCAPYEAKNTYNCRSYSQCKPIARVKNTYKMYQPNELKIMQEIYRNGPVSVSWNPPSYVASYHGGVLALKPEVDEP